MDIKSAEDSFQDVTFNDDTYQKLLSALADSTHTDSYHLCLFIGKHEKSKQNSVQQIADRTDREIKTVDANDIITKIESDTYANLDLLFNRFSANNTLLYLKNGSRLCGSYTGYTQSNVRYATPQERYFLKKVQETGGVFVVDIAVAADVDETMRRAAHSIVHFPRPQSGLKKFMWKMKQIVTVHGHEIKTERPERYRDKKANF